MKYLATGCFLCCFVFSTNAQTAVAFSGILNNSLLTRKTEYFKGDFPASFGYGLSASFENWDSDKAGVRYAMNCSFNRTAFVYNNYGMSYDYKRNVHYQFLIFNLQINYLFRVVKKDRIRFDLTYGISLAGLFGQSSYGDGSQSSITTSYDSLGHPHQGWTSNTWTRPKTSGNYLQPFNCGVDFGMRFIFGQNDHIQYFIENDYTLYLINFLAGEQEEKIPSSLLLMPDLHLGIIYNLQ